MFVPTSQQEYDALTETLGGRIVPLTDEPCPLCECHHPANAGITPMTRYFECDDCGHSWEDTWCCDADDECPNCGTDCASLRIVGEEIVEEPFDPFGYGEESIIRSVVEREGGKE